MKTTVKLLYITGGTHSLDTSFNKPGRRRLMVDMVVSIKTQKFKTCVNMDMLHIVRSVIIRNLIVKIMTIPCPGPNAESGSIPGLFIFF